MNPTTEKKKKTECIRRGTPTEFSPLVQACAYFEYTRPCVLVIFLCGMIEEMIVSETPPSRATFFVVAATVYDIYSAGLLYRCSDLTESVLFTYMNTGSCILHVITLWISAWQSGLLWTTFTLFIVISLGYWAAKVYVYMDKTRYENQRFLADLRILMQKMMSISADEARTGPATIVSRADYMKILQGREMSPIQEIAAQLMREKYMQVPHPEHFIHSTTES